MNNVWEVQIVEYLSEKEFQNIDFLKKKKTKQNTKILIHVRTWNFFCQMHYAKWKKSVSKGYILHEYIYMAF